MSDLKSLGRYQIRGVLGQGAMGLVYEGLDPKLNRRVAIKTILTRKLSPDAARMATVRFEREVKAVARLNHPNVVQVYDFATEGDLAYIVMEFVQGKELKDFLDANERFDLKRIFGVMAELLSALDFAHEAGIIHRDVKPANVMVTVDGHSKLTDFGVARFTEPDASQIDMTRAGQLIGTPSYMSPEQIQGQTIDRRSDVFSAGILLYQLLTWKKPFSGSQWELAKKIIEDDPVWPSKVVEIPPEIDRVVARAMAKQPERRYQTARKFAEALQRVAEGKAPEEPGEIVPTGKASEAEQEFWDGVKDSTDADEIALYMEQFPNGAFVALAQKRIAELSAKKKK
jgi:eukaryotic-like serine/threonine-protein kinase